MQLAKKCNIPSLNMNRTGRLSKHCAFVSQSRVGVTQFCVHYPAPSIDTVFRSSIVNRLKKGKMLFFDISARCARRSCLMLWLHSSHDNNRQCSFVFQKIPHMARVYGRGRDASRLVGFAPTLAGGFANSKTELRNDLLNEQVHFCHN